MEPLNWNAIGGGILSSHQFAVGIAEIRIVKGPTLLECHGIGSCIALFAYDSAADVSGVANIVLPKRLANSTDDRPGTFVDTAVEFLRNELLEAGAQLENVKWAYVGGAEFLKLANGTSLPILEVGRRNAEAMETEMERLGIVPIATDIGGTIGRDISFCTADAELKVRTIHEGEKTLCSLQ